MERKEKNQKTKKSKIITRKDENPSSSKKQKIESKIEKNEKPDSKMKFETLQDILNNKGKSNWLKYYIRSVENYNENTEKKFEETLKNINFDNFKEQIIILKAPQNQEVDNNIVYFKRRDRKKIQLIKMFWNAQKKINKIKQIHFFAK